MKNKMKEKIKIINDMKNIYFLKVGKVRYLKSKNYKKNCCQICGKRRKTTAHHLIPRRLHCICPFLTEIRVRVCSECDIMFHPENRFIRESEVIKRQSQNISNLKDAIYWRNNKIRRLMKGLKELDKYTDILLNLKDENFYKKIIKKEDKENE